MVIPTSFANLRQLDSCFCLLPPVSCLQSLPRPSLRTLRFGLGGEKRTQSTLRTAKTPSQHPKLYSTVL